MFQVLFRHNEKTNSDKIFHMCQALTEHPETRLYTCTHRGVGQCYLRPVSGCTMGCWVTALVFTTCLGLLTFVLDLANSSLMVWGRSGSNRTPCCNKTSQSHQSQSQRNGWMEHQLSVLSSESADVVKVTLSTFDIQFSLNFFNL